MSKRRAEEENVNEGDDSDDPVVEEWRERIDEVRSSLKAISENLRWTYAVDFDAEEMELRIGCLETACTMIDRQFD